MSPTLSDSVYEEGDMTAAGARIALPVTAIDAVGVTGSSLCTRTCALRGPTDVGFHRRLKTREPPGGSGNAAVGPGDVSTIRLGSVVSMSDTFRSAVPLFTIWNDVSCG